MRCHPLRYRVTLCNGEPWPSLTTGRTYWTTSHPRCRSRRFAVPSRKLPAQTSLLASRFGTSRAIPASTLQYLLIITTDTTPCLPASATCPSPLPRRLSLSHLNHPSLGPQYLSTFSPSLHTAHAHLASARNSTRFPRRLYQLRHSRLKKQPAQPPCSSSPSSMSYIHT